jgi:hypothetical protein
MRTSTFGATSLLQLDAAFIDRSGISQSTDLTVDAKILSGAQGEVLNIPYQSVNIGLIVMIRRDCRWYLDTP